MESLIAGLNFLDLLPRSWLCSPVQYFTLLQNRPLFQVIYPGYLWARDKMWLLSRVQRLAGPARGQGPFVPGGATNRDKRGTFCPGWYLQPGQKAPVPPPLARLAFGPGTKATYCLGPKGCRDKWPGTKACFVVVFKPFCATSSIKFRQNKKTNCIVCL